MLKRFTHFRHTFFDIATVSLGASLLLAVPSAVASVPTVVSSSAAAYTSGYNGYINKLATDPSGNVFVTDSSNGRLWEIPVGSASPVQIFLQSTAATAGTTVTAVRITNPGSGYTTAPTVTFTGGGFTGAAAGTAYISAAGAVTLVQITAAGAGYTSAPTVTFSAPPAGGTTATGVATILPVLGLAATHGFTTDKYGDVIVSSGTNGNLYFLPNKNGTLNTLSNAAGTGPLDLTGSNGFSTLDDYYGVVADAAIDNSGNLYVAMSHCNNSGSNACGTSGNSIFLLTNITNKTTATTIATAGTASLFIGSLPGGKVVLNMALDNNGHLFYVDGSKAYVVSTTSGANPVPTVLGSGFTAPSGISVDAAGNVYIVDNSTKLLTEIPNENGTLTPADQFVVASMTNPYYSVGFDAAGTIYQPDGTDKTIQKITRGALNLSASAVGTASATGVINFRFNAAATPASFSFVQGTGAATEFKSTASTCTATSYTATGSCSITVSMTPASTGTRRGAIVLLNSSNKPIGRAYLSGTGTGSALTVDPGTQTTLTAKSVWVSPSAVALDPTSNIYVADAGANAVQVISSSGAATATIGSGLSNPGGVAVDGAGNVFISDTGNNRVVEVPNEGGTLNTADQIVVVSSGLTSPTGLAIDPTGALYIANTGAATPQVVRYTTFDGPGALAIQSTVGSGFTKPSAVAADNAGNIYVADESTNDVSVVNLVTGVQSTLPTPALSAPTSIALDASGALYVVNSGSNSLVRYANVGGNFNTTSGLILGSLSTPTGVAVNGTGNVAIADAGAGTVSPGAYTLVRTSGYINFGNVNITLTSSTQSLILTAAGTASTTLGAAPYTASGNTADFNIVTPSNCSASLILSVGATCQLQASFAPVVTSGTLTETLALSSNAVNTTGATAVLTGVATNLSLSTTTLAQVAPAAGTSPIFGQSVTVTATVTTARSGVVPTGTVKFFLDGVQQSTIPTLSTTAPYYATITIPSSSLAVGTHAITASYSGDTNNASSNTTVAQTLVITVTKQTTTTAATVLPTIAQAPGSTFTFSVVVTPSINGGPSGTLNLVAAGTTSPALATAPVQQVKVNGVATYVATLTYVPPASGQYQVIYSGDGSFVGSTSNTLSVSIQPPNFTVTISSAAYAVNDGSSIVIPVTITSVSNYSGNVTLGSLNYATAAKTPPCTGLPANATCTFSPGIVSLAAGNTATTNATQTINLTLATSVPPATPYPVIGGVALWPGGIAGLLALAFAARKRRKMLSARLTMLAVLLTLAGTTVALSGCGSASGISSATYPTPKGTTSVTLTFQGSPANGLIPVSATNPNITNTVTFQLTVQ